MLEALSQQPPDGIFHLLTRFRADARPAKIDLGVGVYRDATGNTPIMHAIKTAERRLIESQTTKVYTSLAGDPLYNSRMRELVLGHDDPGRLASVATPGGTGAVRQGLDLVRMARPDARVWISDPSWPNHASIASHLGLGTRSYRYLDPATQELDFAGLAEDLRKTRAGDVVVLHGCCHNPSGAGPDPDEWDEIITILEHTGALAFVDLAYQGFGDGLDADARATRDMVARLPEVMIAASCSKNFGVYRERAGIIIVATSPARRAIVQSNLEHLNRQVWSIPPDHGTRLVTMVLDDPELRADWLAELEHMRVNMLDLRGRLTDELRRATNSDRFDFIARHRGMFTRLGLDEDQVTRLREEFAIYLVAGSRVNIAGLTPETIPRVAQAIAAVI